VVLCLFRWQVAGRRLPSRASCIAGRHIVFVSAGVVVHVQGVDGYILIQAAVAAGPQLDSVIFGQSTPSKKGLSSVMGPSSFT
jgi:hypothetical protein